MLASNDRQSDRATNGQTFYYTNMSPQIQDRFNASIWAALERNCHNMICSDTLYMVTGAYFENTNTTCEDNPDPDNDKPSFTVVVPTHFYKVLIRSKSGNTGRRSGSFRLMKLNVRVIGSSIRPIRAQVRRSSSSRWRGSRSRRSSRSLPTFPMRRRRNSTPLSGIRYSDDLPLG